ncbi:MAG: hypothetical protein C4567_00195 [Deltaproteobacteria bacterium]|nr:MAG: hypothetical protein C4567_00195 [Deltaproteobacteria bacterium]
MAETVNLKQGEAKKLTLTVTDETGAAVDLSDCTLFLAVKPPKGEGYAFSKNHGDFDLSQAALGIISVFLAQTDTDRTPGPYVGELKVIIPGAPATVEKSGDLALSIERAVTA